MFDLVWARIVCVTWVVFAEKLLNFVVQPQVVEAHARVARKREQFAYRPRPEKVSSGKTVYRSASQDWLDCQGEKMEAVLYAGPLDGWWWAERDPSDFAGLRGSCPRGSAGPLSAERCPVWEGEEWEQEVYR